MATNEQKYKTAEERVKEFMDFYGEQKAETCKRCMFHKNGCIGSKVSRGFLCYQNWLALEAEEEKPEPCPFCGREVIVGFSENIHKEKYRQVWCKDTERCGYECAKMETEAEAIAAHNRVARAVRAAGESEVR